MSDRTSAGLFSDIFEYLAKEPQDERTKVFARQLWKMTGSYDFSDYQLGCDKALIKLGLARKMSCEHYDTFIQYADRSGKFEEREDRVCEDH